MFKKKIQGSCQDVYFNVLLICLHNPFLETPLRISVNPKKIFIEYKYFFSHTVNIKKNSDFLRFLIEIFYDLGKIYERIYIFRNINIKYIILLEIFQD